MIIRSRVKDTTVEVWDIDRHMAVLAAMSQDGFRSFDVMVDDLSDSDATEPFIVTCSIISAAECMPYYTIPCTSRRSAEWTAKEIVKWRGPIPESVRDTSFHKVQM